MTLKKHRPISRLIFAVTLITTLLLVRLPAPGQAGSTLPDRATPTPASSGGNERGKDSGLPGAYIELQVRNAPVGAWSVVQWQDSAEGWHDVEGWQGTLDENGRRRWWAAEKDFGKGPFRWVVGPGSQGLVLGISDMFDLPDKANETVRVTVELK